ncbi:MAG: hypothetical protein ABI665_12870 [Vicinamibacterales bacterium]
MTRSLLAFGLVCVAAAACGKKGPPLPPFPRVPAQVGSVVAARVGEDVYLSFGVPKANVDGHEPADIAAVEIYAVTSMHPPETEEQRKVATLLATLPVRQIIPPLPPLKDGTPAPVLPIPPGLDRGTTAVFREPLTPALRVPVTLPAKPGPVAPTPPVSDVEPLAGPLVAPAPTDQPHRYYFVVAVSPRGRKAVASAPAPATLDPAAAPPSAPVVTYSERAFTLTWSPSAEASTATMEPPAPVVPAPPAAPGNATPGNVTPVAIELPVLPAKSLGFNTQATTYHVFEIKTDAPEEDPLTLKMPPALTPAPIATAEFVLPGVTYGVERCFAVRAVDTRSGAVVQGAESPKTCITPRDTFPPAVPKSLGAIAGAGVINLIWEPNSEPDLAGYIVLRGEAPGDTLQAITPAPVKETTYRDTTVRPGVRYVYAVVAVDTADPPNLSGQSNRAEETARQ